MFNNIFSSSELKKRGIIVLSKLPDKTVVHLSTQVADKVSSAFSNDNIDYMRILKILIETPMYTAKSALNGFKAYYYYKDSAILINESTDLNYVNTFIFHECIRRVQERINKKNKIERFGICEINDSGVKAQALNEGAIQYIISKALEEKTRYVNSFGVFVSSQAPIYQMLVNIIETLCIITGQKVILDSALNGNEEFKIAIINELGENAYSIIEKRTEDILRYENTVYNSNNILAETNKYKDEIKKAYFEIQDQIYRSYFDSHLKRAENEKDIMTLIKKMARLSRIIGYSPDNKNFYSYKTEFFNKVYGRLTELKTKSLVVISDNPIIRLLNKIKTIFAIPKEGQAYYKGN